MWLDPLVRGPIFGSLFIAAALAVFGVFAFVRREGLVGECVAHATYPGIILAALVAGFLGLTEAFFAPTLLALAFAFGWFALKSAAWLQRKCLSADSSLGFILAAFFSIGMLGSSLCQHLFPFWQRQTTAYLFGQIALMDDIHLTLGLGLLALATGYTILFFKEAQSLAFDPTFTRASGLRTRRAEACYLLVLALSIVLAIKSVGVVLLSGLLIAPAIIARQCTTRLVHMLWLAPLFAALAVFFGAGLSLSSEALAPGPLIILVLSALSLLVHLVAPREGLVVRWLRRYRFRLRCLEENLLKVLWRLEGERQVGIDRESLRVLHLGARWLVAWKSTTLRRRGDLEIDRRRISLSEQGRRRAKHIVRLHRLWEAYLSTKLDVSASRVHASAEQIEHILTPELEAELEMLVDTANDPHEQAIPAKEGA